MKFTKQGAVNILVERKDGRINFSVTDSGEGIAEADHENIFDKFKQVGKRSVTGEKGTGLVLPIVKDVVELHGGNISVQSQEGKGSTFSVSFAEYSKATVDSEIVRTMLRAAHKIGRSILLLQVRIDNCYETTDICDDSVFSTMTGAIEQHIIREGYKKIYLFRRDNRSFMVVLECEQNKAVGVSEQLRQIVKGVLFEFAGNVDFSYGSYFVLDNEERIENSFECVKKAVHSEKEERQARKILLVDDEPIIIDTITRVLNGVGYNNIDEAGDGEASLEKIKINLPNLIVLDMKMPKMTGYELIGRLKENKRTKDIPIIIVSGQEVNSGELIAYMKNKAIPTISKPIDWKVLKQCVYYLL